MDWYDGVSVRPAVGDDIDWLCCAEEVCFPDPWTESILTRGMGGGLDFFFILEVSGNPAGYGCLRVIGDEAEVQRIAVCPGFCRLGLGKKLMDAMAEFSRGKGVKSMSLEVRSENRAARSLYSISGFRQEGLRRDYYRNPKDDAVIMWRRDI